MKYTEWFEGRQYMTFCRSVCPDLRARVERAALPWIDEHGARRLALLGCGHSAIEYRESRTS